MKYLNDRALYLLGLHGNFTPSQRVKAKLPTSIFTKKGPGVTASAKRSFYKFMDAEERQIAVDRGWVPAAWLR